MTQTGWSIIDALDAIAKNHGASMSAVALAWLRSNPTVSAPIASARTVEQLLEILQIIKLSPQEIEQLNTASR
jgi:aryl-alcohol dehydrogenase-like predicted oxidoreductase